MRGVEDAKGIVAAYLGDRIGAKLDELAVRLGVDAVDLPRPALIATEDRPTLATDETPALLVVAQDDELTLVDRLRNGTDDVYAVRYRLRVYCFVRHDGYAAVSALRDRYALAVRELLLAQPSVGDGDAAVAPSTVRASYSDVAVDDVGRSLAGAYLEFVLDLAETLTSTPVGTVATTTVTTEPMPHPALA